jgi:hypothetical protein
MRLRKRVRFYMTNFLYREQSQLVGIHVPVNMVMEKANIGLVCLQSSVCKVTLMGIFTIKPLLR